MTKARSQLRKAFKDLGLKVKHVVKGKWEVRKTIWPYPEGYGTYHTGKRMVLDTGLTKERAQEICDEMNK